MANDPEGVQGNQTPLTSENPPLTFRHSIADKAEHTKTRLHVFLGDTQQAATGKDIIHLRQRRFSIAGERRATRRGSQTSESRKRKAFIGYRVFNSIPFFWAKPKTRKPKKLSMA